MAIVQVSRITHRKGLAENLPQLAGAELGWAINSRQLFIGNGTLEDGAPVIGNTEILTEFSDVTALSTYTYSDIAVGYAAQTGASPSEPVVRTVQQRLDDQANVRNFGAVGDGVTDDTAAINRALQQLFSVQSNTQVRRSLFFPAGTYRVTDTVVVPTYARVFGEGADSTIIRLDSPDDSSLPAEYVIRYGDSAQQTGASIGTNGATAPRNIEIESMTFKTTLITDVLLIEGAMQCSFTNVNFEGPIAQADNELDNIAGVRFDDIAVPTPSSIIFDKCGFRRLTYGIKTDVNAESVTVTNGVFDGLFRGVELGAGATVSPGPHGFRIIGNKFDNIFAEGIVFNNAEQNVSGYNLFLDVGNDFSSTPTKPCISIGNDNNVSMYDMFERTDSQTLIEPRIRITGSANATASTIANGTSSQLQLGRYTRETGKTYGIDNNSTDQVIVTVNTNEIRGFSLAYTIVRDTAVRSGTLTVVSFDSDDSALTLSYTDDYVENADVGVTLEAVQITGSQAVVRYTSTNTGLDGTLTYSISHLA